MRVRQRQVLALFVLAATLATVLLVAACDRTESPSIGSTTGTGVPSTDATSTSSDDARTARLHAMTAARLRLSQALEIPEVDFEISTRSPILPDALLVLEWDGGSAEFGAVGRILSVTQDQPPVDSSAIFQSAFWLEEAAFQMENLLGWDDELLEAGGLTPPASGIVTPATAVYSKRWVGHDGSGALNDGFAELRLDARDGRLLGFTYRPGQGAIDVSGTIELNQAQAIAELELGQVAVKSTTTAPGQPSYPHGGMSVEENLKMIDDPAITGGKSMLVWVFHLQGYVNDRYISGTAWLDANTGEVLASHAD